MSHQRVTTYQEASFIERTRTDRNQFKPDRYFIASDAIGFGTDPIHFGAPACRFVSIPHRFGLGRIGMQPATRGFGSFRYHFKSKRYRFNPNRYRNDHKQLPLKSINSRDTRFFDITLSPSDITLTQSEVVSSHPEISWSWQRFTPGLRQFIPFCRRLSSGRSDIAPWPTAVSRSWTRLSLRRSDGGPASRSREQDSGGPPKKERSRHISKSCSKTVVFERVHLGPSGAYKSVTYRRRRPEVFERPARWIVLQSSSRRAQFDL